MSIAQAEGTAQPCVTSALLEKATTNGKVSLEDERLFRDVTGVAFGGKPVCVRVIVHSRLTT